MHTLILFSCLIAPFSLISMDTEPIPLADPNFLLWCGALTCKEVKKEQVTNITPRQFLGIDETNISTEIFHIPHEEIDNKNRFAPQERIEMDIRKDTCVIDRRLGGRWRCLDDGTPQKPRECERDAEFAVSLDSHGRHYLERYFTHSCCGNHDEGRAVSIPLNSIPQEGGYYLYAGTCAHKDGNVWVHVEALQMELANIRGNKDKAERFPLRILWVEPFKKPIIMQEILVPGKTYDVVSKSVAVKFIEDETKFQLFYDASAKKTEWVTSAQSTPSETSRCSITVSSPVVHRDPPSLWIYTYALDRIQKLGGRVGTESLARWYETYQRMKQGALKEHELAETAAHMNSVINGLEVTTISE